MIRILLCCLLICCAFPALAQENNYIVKGQVTNHLHQPLHDAVVSLKENKNKVVTGRDGNYVITAPVPGRYTLLVSAVGYLTQKLPITIQRNTTTHDVQLRAITYDIKEVEIKETTTTQKLKEQAFTVEVLNTKNLRDRNVDINRLLDALPGIRVRESGGLGSSFQYSIHGLSGKAVRFFLDGVPMETFGNSFSINNIPVNAIDHVEVYKGVVPVSLGSDALGGAINLVTRKDLRNFLDASYSYGSYNTHKASLSGRWQHPRNGFTIAGYLGHNYTDNNYKVWGPTVEIADESGRPVATDQKFRRFNDDFRNSSGRLEAGITGKTWADQLMLGVNISALRKGIQTGRTMAFVYGDVRYQEYLVMPTVRYVKKEVLNGRLNIDLFAAFNRLQGTTIDTGSRKYNWAGHVIADDVTGEMGGIRAQRSRYTFTENTSQAVANVSYRLNEHHMLYLNHTFSYNRRIGKDDIAQAEWTIPFREPQQLQKQITGLSYETSLFDDKWSHTFFAKHFRYSASANIYDYNSGAQKEVIKQVSNNSSWGFGYATRWNAGEHTRLKLSVEKTSRLPDAAELLGDGNTILNAPTLKPERSFNINAGIQQQWSIGASQFHLEAGGFFRNVQDLIWLGEGNLFGTARYENINSIRSTGTELAVAFSHKKWLEISANGTWQDVRNRQRYTSSGAPNIVFNDGMKNMPSLMANAEIRIYYPEKELHKNHWSAYVNTHYVDAYFLNWPSLGDRSVKKTIPEQFVQDAGLSYRFHNNDCSISVECRNMLDKQVYDNYLLQKPGRFTSITFRYFLHNQTHK